MQLSAAMIHQINTGAFVRHWFISVTAKNRSTNQPEHMHLWTGDGNFTTLIDGVITTFIGSGNLLEIPTFTYSQGVDIKEHRMTLNILSPEIINLIRAYDSQFAPITFHLGIFRPDTMALMGVSQAFNGFIDKIEIDESENDEYCGVSVVSGLREGTKPLTLMKSQESQKLRDETDEGFKYSTIAGTVLIQWAKASGGYQVPFMRRGLSGAIQDARERSSSDR